MARKVVVVNPPLNTSEKARKWLGEYARDNLSSVITHYSTTTRFNFSGDPFWGVWVTTTGRISGICGFHVHEDGRVYYVTRWRPLLEETGC